MNLSELQLFKIVQIAIKGDPKNELVRRKAIEVLQTHNSWDKEKRDLATKLLQTGDEKEINEEYVRKVPYGKNKSWDEQIEKVLRTDPELANDKPLLLEVVVRVLDNTEDTRLALEYLDRLINMTKDDTRKRRELIPWKLRLLPELPDPEEIAKRIVDMKSDCLNDFELTTAIKDLCLKHQIPVKDAIEIFEKWEIILRETGSGQVDSIIKDKHSLLKMYLESHDLDSTLEVLRYCSSLENLPSGIDVEEMVDRIIGLFNETTQTFEKSLKLFLQAGDFCLTRHRYNNAHQYYSMFKNAGGKTLDIRDRLERLIGEIKNIGENRFLDVYLNVYHNLGTLLCEQGKIEQAEEKLREIKHFFFQIRGDDTTRQLVNAKDTDAEAQVLKLRGLYSIVLERISEKRPDDTELLEDMGLLAYSSPDWKKASNIYERLIQLYIKRQETKKIYDLYHRFYWCYYFLDELHRILPVIDEFIRQNRFTKDLDLDSLRVYCAAGFHELVLAGKPMQEARARKYLQIARNYYEELMKQPLNLINRPYLPKMADMLDEGVRESPFEYIDLKPDIEDKGKINKQIFNNPKWISWGWSVEELVPLSTTSGFGEVYRLRLKIGNESVYRALKLLKRNIPGEDMGSVQKNFNEEVKIMHDLEHENIVRFFDAGTMQEQQYILMEYVEGSDMEKFILQEGPMKKLSDKLEMFLNICKGVHYLHYFGKGIVHRDLHPKNVLVGGKDGEIVKVADFGLARVLDDEGIHKSSRVRGRHFYVPPETLKPREEPYTVQGDIYSLGKILCFMLAGSVTADRHRIEDVAGEEFSRICEKATSDEPNRRHNNVYELIIDINTVMSHLPKIEKKPVKINNLQPPLTSLEKLFEKFPPMEGHEVPTSKELQSGNFIKVDAIDTSNEKKYSIKFISALQRTGQEVYHRLDNLKQITNLNHPNIEHVINFGELRSPSSCFYIQYEHIPGESLMDLMMRVHKTEKRKSGATLTVAFVIQVGKQMADALMEVHRQGILHRIFSPAKIMVDLLNGKCTLTDFSVAVLKEGQNISDTAEQYGDKHYLAPEALNPDEGTIDETTDLFGLGATLISLLWGWTKISINNEEVQKLLFRHNLDIEQSEILANLLNSLTQYERKKRRFNTAEEFNHALLEISNSMGVDVDNVNWRDIEHELAGEK